MQRCQRKRQKKPLDFAYAFRSFVGYLEGTDKAAHTIKNYRSDLRAFQDFLENGLGSRTVPITQLVRSDLEKYHGYLKAQGFKTNTRRRKLMTVRKLLNYLVQRGKLTIDVGRKLPAPAKVERVPFTAESTQLLAKIRELPQSPVIQARNRVLLWTLAETGCQVSELAQMRYDQWSASPKPDRARLEILGKGARVLDVSADLYDAVEELRMGTGEWLFLGFNKFGSLGGPITPRGVEILVKSFAEKLGVPGLTPRTFRHSAILSWYKEGVSRDEIQQRLGLKTAYAFRVYEPLFKSAGVGIE